MESQGEPLEELADAEAARERLAARQRLPRMFAELLGLALALSVASVAVALHVDGPWDAVLLVAGIVVLPLSGLVQIARFRRLNGTALDGLATSAMTGSVGGSTIAYVAAFAATQVAAERGSWLLVCLTAGAGGALEVWLVRRWWRRYQDDPMGQVVRTPVSSTRVLLLVVVVGLVLLVVTGR